MKRLIPAILLSAAIGVPGAYGAERLTSSYAVSVLGLPIASSSFTTTIEGNVVTIDGTLKSSGIARIFDDTIGSTKVRARVGKGGIVPAAYDVRYVSGKKNKRTAISFAGGRVAKTYNNPPLRKRPNYVDLTPAHLNGVFDPLTALMLRADSPGEVCGRTVRIYDGETRVDLKLSPAGSQPFSTEGFKGEAIRCSVKFVPVAGYRTDKKQIQYLKNQSKIEIAFAPLGAGNLYAPVKAVIGTQIGPVTIYATRFASAN